MEGALKHTVLLPFGHGEFGPEERTLVNWEGGRAGNLFSVLVRYDLSKAWFALVSRLKMLTANLRRGLWAPSFLCTFYTSHMETGSTLCSPIQVGL